MNRWIVFPSFFLFSQTKPAKPLFLLEWLWCLVHSFNVIALIAAINLKPNNASLWHQSFFSRCLVFLSARNGALAFTKASGDLMLFTLDIQTTSIQRLVRETRTSWRLILRISPFSAKSSKREWKLQYFVSKRPLHHLSPPTLSLKVQTYVNL